MRRPEYYRGGYFHLYNRGAHRVSLFREPDNYVFVLRKVKKYVSELELTVIAYCLLPNHYHFLLRQAGEHRAGLLPQRVFNSYSKAYNRRYGHSGTLFEGPYKAKEVRSDAHLIQLCPYIHANPVIHGLVASPHEWIYSNYLEWVGERGGTLVDRGFVLDHFASPREYRAFVQEYMADRALPDQLSGYLSQWDL